MVDESKHDRFVRLSGSRGDRLVREIRLIGNLANRKNYDYSRSEVDELFEGLNKEMQDAKRLFEEGLLK